MSDGPEQRLAADLTAWLGSTGWELYEEVDVAPLGRADVVAVRGPLVHIIEAKVSLGLAVMLQAARWRGHANLASVVTRAGYRAAQFTLSAEILTALGLGWYTVEYGGVHEAVAPRLLRRTSGQVRRMLRPEHQTYARAGSNGGGYYTAFRATAARLVEAVRAAEREAPWRTLIPAEVCASIPHHYGTARSAASALTAAVERGWIPELEVVEEPYGRVMRRRLRSRRGLPENPILRSAALLRSSESGS